MKTFLDSHWLRNAVFKKHSAEKKKKEKKKEIQCKLKIAKLVGRNLRTLQDIRHCKVGRS